MSRKISISALGRVALCVLASLYILPAGCAPQRRVEPRRPVQVSRRATTNIITRLVSVLHEGLVFAFRLKAVRRAKRWRLSVAVDVSTRSKGYKLSGDPFFVDMRRTSTGVSSGGACDNFHEIKSLAPGRVRTYRILEAEPKSADDHTSDVALGENLSLVIGFCRIPSSLGRPVPARHLLLVNLTVQPRGRVKLAVKPTTAIHALAVGNWNCSDGTTIKIGPGYLLVLLEKKEPYITISGRCRLKSKQGRVFNLMCAPAVLDRNVPALARAVRQLPCARSKRRKRLWHGRHACLRPLLPDSPASVTIELRLNPKSAETTLYFPKTGRTCTTKFQR